MITVIGDYIIDLYIYGVMERMSPESPIPIFRKINEHIGEGGAGNVAANLRAMGNDVFLHSQMSHYPTKKRYVVGNQIVFRCDEEKYIENTETEYKIPDDCRYVVLSDYNKGYLHNSNQIIEKLIEQGKYVIVDPKKHVRNYVGAHVVKFNEKEFVEYTGKSLNETSIEEVRNTYNIDDIVVTLGSMGVMVNDRRYFSTESVLKDVTGAGDVFIAAMTHFLSHGYDIYEACKKANMLAGISVTKFGTYTVTEEDMKQTRTIFTNGCFDILHRGHVDYLRKSKELGRKLIVGLNSDASIKRLKGESRPINSQEDRKEVLESLGFVDEVIIFDEDTPYELIKQIKPDVITKGGDYTPDEVVGNDLAQVIIVPKLEGYSTTDIIRSVA